ncbi:MULTISPECIES: SpaA isopeptide-forming pilin-related protein [Bacillus amyloliquefaciens group]|uniref:SpaA isopeptide-forming pilin-related protein n=1 Tax=Bacillus amyloliquefaciens group TaxID=1938374 RepID=UPI001459F81E|nr:MULTISPECIES: SpaA isopeptide-forming pilin-related protein [Bacillus amyloliquefaciens group]MCR4364295.1 SpaA isopeptide-forming pilin-related protein [Bacillus amyloliquefaciens]MCV3201635.1 SpaA isopeptide-forming pilin-related protein [Bacillus velezensis]MDP1504324.1 SpaA isopeptide-forming pilin-related protein [Bacillus velezensis]MDP1508183.1 SpaA isopeptide-forming pilin-related protein [Bacillus velezensis]MDW0357328.1 LPXTG cell wall anchor domain-containing protein [Bacillus ve
MGVRNFSFSPKKSKRLRPALISCFTLFFIFSQVVSFTPIAAASGSQQSESGFFDSVAVKDGRQQTVDGSKASEPALAPGDKVTLTYEWSLKNKEDASDRNITLKIPESFTLDNEAEGELTSADRVIGIYKAEADSSTLEVKVNDAEADAGDAKGSITLSAKFTPDITDETKMAKALFQLDAGKTQQVLIPVKKDGTTDSETEKNTSSTPAEPQEKTEKKSVSADGGEKAEQTTKPKPSAKRSQSKMAVSSKSAAKSLQSGGSRITQNILTDVKLTDEKGKPYDKNNPANTNSPANITIQWAIPNELGKTINDGDRYEFDLPKEFIMHNDITNQPLTDGDSTYGTFSINTSGHVIMTFNGEVKEDSNVKGSLYVNTQFNQKEIKGSTTQKIKFPVHSDTPDVTVYFKPNVNKTIEKSGSLDKGINPGKVTWTVDLNKKEEEVKNAKLTESLPDELIFRSVKVYELDVNIDGSVSQGNEITSGYTVGENGNVTFAGTIDTAYRLIYDTEIKDEAKPGKGGNITLTNKAAFSGDNAEPISAEASVTAGYGKMIEKSSTGYKGESQTFSWAVMYNYGEKKIDQSKAGIKDTFGSDDLHLVPGSLKVLPITFSQNGSEQEGAPLKEGGDYTLTDNGNGFEIKFKQTVTGAYKIIYQSQVNDGVIIDSPVKYTNTAMTDTGESKETPGTAIQQNLIKNYSNADYEKKTVDWTITVNKNGYTMKDWTLDDQFTSGGLALIDDSFHMQDTTDNKTLKEGTDYTLTKKPGNQGFTIALIGDYAETNSQFKITYTTKFNADFSNEPIKNTAESTWTDKNGGKRTNKESSGFTPNNQTSHNGFKNGSYNAVSKEITWKVGINYNGEPSKNPYIKDTITDGQQFLHGSVAVKTYTISKNGSITEGEALDPSKYEIEEPSDGNKNTLIVRLKTDDALPYLIEFKTSLKGQVIKQNQYTNKAEYFNNDHADRTLTGSVSIANGGNLISKGGKQNGNNIDWNINVNASQSTLDDVKVKDTPDENQIIDEDSFKVYQAKYNENGVMKDSSGNLIPGDVQLEKDKDYKLDIKTDNATGEQSFVLTFTGGYKQIDRAYVIQYRSLINISGSSGQVSNKVSISGTNVEEQTQENNSSVFVAISSGGGSGSGEKGSLTISKTGSDGTSLSGAGFQLWSKDGKQLLRTGTTDDAGKLTFGNIRYGTYVLKEIKAPDGYTISDAYVNGVSVTIDGKSSAAGALYKVINQKNKVTLIKKDENNKPLAGAVFKLEKKSSDGTYTLIKNNIESDKNGKVEINGLPAGYYRLMETKAPSGFIVNTKAIHFSIAKNEKNQVPDVELGSMVNYQGKAALTKKDADGGNLEGAVFKIVDSDGKTVQKDLVSDKDGKIETSGLAPGHYAFIETKAPNGYVLNTEKVEFTISETAEGKPESTDAGTAVNYKGSVRLTKEDAEGRNLEGAVFKIVDSDGKTVKEDLVSDKDGKVETSGLAPGHYAFIETKAPDGYVLNTEKKEFTISETAEGKPKPSDAGTAVNYKGSVQLIKKDQDGNVLDGAVFKIIDSDGKTVRDDLMTKEGGKIDAGGLAPGNYQFVETKAPDGYLLSTTPVPFTIKAENSGKPNQAALTAVNIKNSVVLTKLDQGDKRKVLQGAKFNLTDANGKVLTEGLTTDEHGQIIVRGLKAGEYQFIETKAPELYSLDQTPISFKITNTDIKPVEISAENTLTPGDVTLTKVDHDDKNKVLEGAEFKITDSAGHPVNTGGSKERPAVWKTDQKGRFTVKGLAPGQYRFIETKAPDGYQLNEKPIEFTIEKGQLKAVEVVVSNKKLKNPAPGKDTPNHQTNQGGHHPDTNGKTNHSDTGKNLPKTGDTDGMMPVTAGILLLLAGGAAAVVSRKKKARNR